MDSSVQEYLNKSLDAAFSPTRKQPARSSSAVLCHICGSKVTVSSLQFHTQACKAKCEAAQKKVLPLSLVAVVSLEVPDIPLPTEQSSPSVLREYNAAAAQFMKESKPRCPECHKIHTAERLIAHMRKCCPKTLKDRLGIQPVKLPPKPSWKTDPGTPRLPSNWDSTVPTAKSPQPGTPLPSKPRSQLQSLGVEAGTGGEEGVTAQETKGQAGHGGTISAEKLPEKEAAKAATEDAARHAEEEAAREEAAREAARQESEEAAAAERKSVRDALEAELREAEEEQASRAGLKSEEGLETADCQDKSDIDPIHDLDNM